MSTPIESPPGGCGGRTVTPGYWVRTMHPWGFRSGQWARIVTWDISGDRPLWTVQFPDGQTDRWAIGDTDGHYEFSSVAPPVTVRREDYDAIVEWRHTYGSSLNTLSPRLGSLLTNLIDNAEAHDE